VQCALGDVSVLTELDGSSVLWAHSLARTSSNPPQESSTSAAISSSSRSTASVLCAMCAIRRPSTPSSASLERLTSIPSALGGGSRARVGWGGGRDAEPRETLNTSSAELELDSCTMSRMNTCAAACV
jgi:hypothetical protein